MKKICTKCGIEKSLNEFWKSKIHKYGVQPNCIKCRKEQKENNKDSILENAKLYYAKNKTRIHSPENYAYIRRLIKKNTLIKDVPQVLIEAKSLQIQIKRYLQGIS